jgi:hypothetical protein
MSGHRPLSTRKSRKDRYSIWMGLLRSSGTLDTARNESSVCLHYDAAGQHEPEGILTGIAGRLVCDFSQRVDPCLV